MKIRKKSAGIVAAIAISGLGLGYSVSANTPSSVVKALNKSQASSSDTVNLNELFKFNGNATQVSEDTAQLTPQENYQKGAISGKVGIDLSKDFSLDMDVNLGINKNGADGVGIVFHKGSIGQLGQYGGGLGILGLPGGIGFELDTYWKAAEDDDPSFGHNNMKGPHAGFVSTDANKILTALAPMQYINAPSNTFNNLKLKWIASQNLMTADYGGKHWEINPKIDKSVRYTFEIAGATGAYNNVHTIKVNSFTGDFIRPDLNANDLTINAGEEFNPLDPRIGLKATDEVDGDITNKIKVVSNDVDTSKTGIYHVTYSVTNSQGESTSKTITVTVAGGTWPDGSPHGWRDFSGQNLELLKDPKNALFGDYVFYSKQQSSIYKLFNGQDRLKVGNYRVTVYAKALPSQPANLPLKVTLKKNTSSPDGRTILLANPLSSGELVDKGYYKVSEEFSVAKGETTPLINVENYQGGYIAGIFLTKIK